MVTTKSATVYGASDDVVVVTGVVTEEFYPADPERGGVLVFSDGTVLHVAFGNHPSGDDGAWAVNVIDHGTAVLTIRRLRPGHGDDYSDQITVAGDVAWVVWCDGIELPDGTEAADSRRVVEKVKAVSRG